MEIFANELVRRIVGGIILLGMLFYGAKLRGDAKSFKNPFLERWGKMIHIITIANIAALIVTDFIVETSGLWPFSIAIIVCVVVDAIALIYVIPKANLAYKSEKKDRK